MLSHNPLNVDAMRKKEITKCEVSPESNEVYFASDGIGLGFGIVGCLCPRVVRRKWISRVR